MYRWQQTHIHIWSHTHTHKLCLTFLWPRSSWKLLSENSLVSSEAYNLFSLSLGSCFISRACSVTNYTLPWWKMPFEKTLTYHVFSWSTPAVFHCHRPTWYSHKLLLHHMLLIPWKKYFQVIRIQRSYFLSFFEKNWNNFKVIWEIMWVKFKKIK